MSTLPTPRPASARRWTLLAALALLLPSVVSAAPLAATDTATLRGHVGEQVEVQGTATGTGTSKSGTVAYLNFASAHQGVALVFFLKQGQGGAFASEADLKPYVGKSLTVTGKLEDYKGDLQIKVDSTTQIKAEP